MIGQAYQTSAISARGGWIRWAAAASAILVVGLNAAAFPLWTGFPGGEKPLGSSFQAWPHLALIFANIPVLLFLARRTPSTAGRRLAYVLLLGSITRLVYLAVRTAQGASAVDPDVALYFRYAQSFAGGSYPAMEYPQGALLLFSGAYRLSSGDAARFAIVLPLCLLVFDLITLACLAGLGERWRCQRSAWALGLCYAISPLTLVLWYGKYDAMPAGLLALGSYLFVARRHYLSALALAAGFLSKWFPGIAIAFFAIQLLSERRWRTALGFLALAALAILLPIAFFWSLSPEKVLHTYSFHQNRPTMGESLLYLPVYLWEPAARLAVGTSPWTDVESALIGNTLATWIQIAGIGLALAASVLARRREAAVALAGIGIVAFIILNRVFSPQYTLVLVAAYSMGLISLRSQRAVTFVAMPALLILSLLNYYVWPLWTPRWLLASALFFALNIALALFVCHQTIRARRGLPRSRDYS